MKKVPITSVCEIQVGKTPSRSNPLYWGNDSLWLSIADMNQGLVLEKTKEMITEKAIRDVNMKIIPKDTVLFSFKLSIGKVGITKVPMYSNEAIAAFFIKDHSELDTKFLYYVLKSVDHSIGSNKAVMGKTLNKEQLKKIQIPLPSPEDQKRIVKILDKADALRHKRKQAIGLLDDYLKSVFLEMFGDLNANDKNWEYLEFGNYISILTDYHANGSYEILKKNVTLLNEPDYALMVRTTDLENNNFEKDVKYITEHAYNFLEKSKVYGGEIIINKIGSAGKVYLMPKLNRSVSLGMNAFLLRFNDNANGIFMYYLLTSHYGETIIQKKVRGAVTKTIRKDAIRSLKVPNITIDLQNIFSDIFIKTNKLKQSMLTQSTELETQFQALMQKAFKGELV